MKQTRKDIENALLRAKEENSKDRAFGGDLFSHDPAHYAGKAPTPHQEQLLLHKYSFKDGRLKLENFSEIPFELLKKTFTGAEVLLKKSLTGESLFYGDEKYLTTFSCKDLRQRKFDLNYLYGDLSALNTQNVVLDRFVFVDAFNANDQENLTMIQELQESTYAKMLVKIKRAKMVDRLHLIPNENLLSNNRIKDVSRVNLKDLKLSFLYEQQNENNQVDLFLLTFDDLTRTPPNHDGI